MSEPTEEAEPIEEAEPTEYVEPAEPLDRRYPSTIGGAFYLGVLLVAALGVALVAWDDWRVGLRVVAGALAAAGLARLVLPQRDAGMLAVRHRFIDVGLLVGVAAALYFLAGDIPEQPL